MSDLFADILNAFGKEIGIPDLEFDENGTCSLIFDDIVVNLEKNAESGKLFIYSSLGAIPSNRKEAFFKTLLEANAFFKDTGGGTLAIDDQSNIVLFLYQVHIGTLDQGSFSKTMENYINIVEHWTTRIKEFPQATGTTTPAPEPQHVGMRV